MPHPDSIISLLSLTLIPGLGVRKINTLLQHYGSIEKIFQSPVQDLVRISGITNDVAHQILDSIHYRSAEQEYESMRDRGIQAIPFNDLAYPKLLAEIPYAPLLLFFKGNVDLNEGFPLAFVGSRKASQYGNNATAHLIRELAKKLPETIVISGMALGIDTIAHKTAMECGLKTVAVLAGGLDHLYPPQNRNLAEEINRNGALVSEYPRTTRPLANHFPVRNRIISGLSKGTVILEAGEKSGALITAKYAFDQNREVFAVPGTIFSPLCAGTNRLIQREKAKLILGADDILEEFQYLTQKNLQLSFTTNPEPITSFTEEEERLMSLLNYEGFHVDYLLEISQFPVNRLLSVLTSLEMKGVAGKRVGSIYYLTV